MNEERYDKNHFTNGGISHDDLFFVDGSTPPDKIVNSFLNIVEDHFAKPNHGAVAIHCKAGLGRTGTLIGLWAMKHFQIPAEPFIGWIRIARPGSILGPQQFYLPQVEPNYIHTHHSAQKSKLMTQKFNESPQDKHKAVYGETHQANYLINAKGTNSESRSRRELFNDRTNNSPISSFKDNVREAHGVRENSKILGGASSLITGGPPHSPVKAYNYNRA